VTDTRQDTTAVAKLALERFRPRLHPADAMCLLPQPEPLVHGLLFLPGESIVYGPPKKGKTFWGIDLGLSVSTGTRFQGWGVERHPVIYIAAEGVGGLGNRIEAWREHHGHGPISDAWFLTASVNLLDPGSVDALCTLAVEHQTRLTIIDTIHRCTPGMEENSARDVGRLIESFDQIRDATNGHVHGEHHTGKDATRGMRGSSALLGAVDTAIELSGDTNALRITTTEQKDSPTPAPWWAHLEPAGNSAVLIPMEHGIGVTDQTVLEALHALADDDRTTTKWREMADDHGVSKTAFYEAKRRLLDAGAVTGSGGRGALYAPANQEETDLDGEL
jgi:AAA domain-containing protein